ncbi:hypothetical protein N9L68_09290 [bacterium]|nr:hypothetical protein [bacterium]
MAGWVSTVVPQTTWATFGPQPDRRALVALDRMTRLQYFRPDRPAPGASLQETRFKR